ncbi:hypothetical protein GH714_020170 [Hevea brasiliensis]|uniref:NB-ARC domain-containing protein n=1 Tax=Hevea brasiliensis TaxID=3981 RepID=A0A6A6LI78_HEVBR|nr:hypothetical protein GH714_020170 [Hevea brasiliensis]
MAFAVISMILERLSSFALSGLEQEARLVMDVEREIQKLKYNLESIQVVLDDADVRQRKEASVKLWLHRLKDISYDIDDVWTSGALQFTNPKLSQVQKLRSLRGRIAKAILESLRDTETNSVELQTLLQQMQQSIKGQRFLLVLDDVWTEDARKWENLMHSFKCGERGSRILITTRKENVATRIGCTDILPIGQLSMEECWSVFSQIAFFGKTSIECERVEDIGRKIVKKCKGLPLAAKTLGGLLRFRKFREEWQSVLDSDVWELEEAEKDLLGALWLSYYDLPMALRQCFSYCAIFPKDHLISKPRLIKLWMAQGYLKATKRKDMEMVGEEYFQNLVVRSFFQDFDKCDDEILACKMHDIVHDFAQFLTQNECFSMEVNGFLVPSMYFSGKEPRHSMVVLAENAVLPGSLGSLKKLRTLLIESHGQSEIRAAPPDLLNQLTCLRSLDLSNCGIGEIPPK